MKHEEHGSRTTNECEVCRSEGQKLRNFFAAVEIPIIKSVDQNGQLSPDVKINGNQIYDILMDEDKLKVLFSKLKNKAFW
jgi:hypothetical protein